VEAFESMKVLLVLIDNDWRGMQHGLGLRDRHAQNDAFTALGFARQRQIPVIPVLLEGGQLPRSIERSVWRQPFGGAVEISNSFWNRDVERLIHTLRVVVLQERSAPVPSDSPPVVASSRPAVTSDSPPVFNDKLKQKGDRYTVWFGTNRKPLTNDGEVVGFSSSRDSRTHYGSCHVAVPESHKIGSTGSPLWKRIVTLTDDRLRLQRINTLIEDTYWESVQEVLRSVAVEERDAVVFLHGYNVSFEEAALRSAQLGFDLGIAGVMAFYSWPSKGTLKGYPADEASIDASEGFITDFLTRMATQSGAARVHIIAHSMGNRGLLRAIDRIASTAAKESAVPFNQIILAAADVDRDTFARLSIAYRSVARRTTMYVCAKDKAAEASHWLHDYPRAGLAPPVLVVPGIDTINVSNLDLTLLGHGYVAEARDVLQDMHRLIREGSPPERRFGLRKEVTPEGSTYWMVGA
jgi:esterase/lipase superfamily enzyme